MAAFTWYLTDNSASVGSDLSATDPGTEAFRSPVTGWVVGTGTTDNSPYANDNEQAASTFANTTPPDGSLDTTNGDFWVSPAPLTGDFASGDWNIHLAVRANTGGGSQDGNAIARLFRGSNQDGSGATEITSAQQAGGTVSNINTTTTQVSTVTFNPGAFSVSNEYIFVQLAWGRSGSGATMSNHDVNVRIGHAGGSGSRVVTSDFTSGGGVTVTPGVGQLSLTGLVPSVIIGTVIATGLGALTVTGLAPSVVIGTVASTDVGALTLTGFSPTVTVTDNTLVATFTGELTVTGLAPTVTASDHQTASTGLGQLSLTGFSPSVVIGTVAYPPQGDLTLTGFAPSVVIGTGVAPGVGQLTLTGFSPAVDLTVTAGVGALTLTGFAPSVFAGTTATPATGELTLTGLSPTVSVTEHVRADTALGQLTLTGFAPSVAISDHQTASTATGQLTLTSFAPAVVVNNIISTGVGALTLTSFAPTVTASDHQTVTPGVGALVLTGFSPTAQGSGGTVAEPGVGELVLTGYAPFADIGSIHRINIAGDGQTLRLSVVSALPSLRFGVRAPHAATRITVPTED